MTSADQTYSSSSTSTSSIAIGSTLILTGHSSGTFSSSYSKSQSELYPTSSTIKSSITHTTEQLSSSSTESVRATSPLPLTTITKVADPQPKPITTTIVASTSNSNGLFLETTQVTVINQVKANAGGPLNTFVTTHRDSHGQPTWTETILAQESTITSTYTDVHGNPTSTQTIVVLLSPQQTVLTDYQGRATKTQNYYLGSSTQILYDKDGRPTATKTSVVTETAMLTTLFDSNSVPTETKTELVPMSLTTTVVVTPTSKPSPNSESAKALRVVPISNGKYFLGLMLPTFVAIIVSIPIRIIDRNAKLYQPFHALASSGPAQARDSVCFRTAGIWNLTERIRSLLNGQILLTLTGLLLLGSVIMIPLSSEAVRIILEGPDCAASTGDTLTCTMVLGVYPVPAQIAVALLAFMAVLVGIVVILVRKWKTGLEWNPWSLFHMGHLGTHSEIRTLLLRRLREKNGRITNKDLDRAFAGVPFYLDYWKDNADLKYSILISNETPLLKKDGKVGPLVRRKAVRWRKKENTMPFFILTWTGKLLFLVLLCAMEIGLLIYNITGEGQDYTQFMVGRWRVVRFVFTFIGVLTSLIWGSFFYAVAFLSPHKLFHRIRLYNGEAPYMTPPTNPFSGIWSSLTPGRRDIYLGFVSATAILSEILPLLLSTTLDKCTESFWAHTVCLWMAVSILGIMIFTVAGSFLVYWPHMPIDPSTVAGGMYYALVNFVSMSPSSGLLFSRASPSLV